MTYTKLLSHTGYADLLLILFDINHVITRCDDSQSSCPQGVRIQKIYKMCNVTGSYDVRATSHTRLRARDRYTLSTLIGGKGGAGPSLLHTTFERPTEYVKARWM
jgi:hypothetical protein